MSEEVPVVGTTPRAGSRQGTPAHTSTTPWQPVTTPQPAKEPTMCEAQERNKRALYELELQWGAGRLDYGRIKDILTGRGTDCPQPSPADPPQSTACVSRL